jgi:translation initiation factor IF-3
MPKPYASGGRRHQNRGNQIRKNERIRAREVRLLSPEGKQIGVVKREEALELAKRFGLDLVEISASANPPVCRILDFGKFMYEQSKKQKETKARATSSSKIKEVKFRVRTEEHDYLTKLRRGEEFLYKGNKLKLSLMFRGRENEHKELGIEVLRKAGEDLSHVGQADSDPRLSGRHVNMVMSPLPEHRRRLVYNEHVDDSDEES